MVLANYDPAHKVSLVDVELRSGKRNWSSKFKWLVELTIVVGKGVALVAWGKVWAQFVEICQELQEDPDCVFTGMLRPSRFNEIKFAHHAHDLYHKGRHNYNPLIKLLETLKEALLSRSQLCRNYAPFLGALLAKIWRLGAQRHFKGPGSNVLQNQ